MQSVENNIDHIISLIEEAGNAVLKMYNKQNLEIEMKSDATPVTEADKLSHDILTKGLKELFPDIPIISEEANVPDYSVRKKWDYFWLVDPLDGTKEFIYKNGRFCINIALIHKHTPVFGVINNILNEEIIWAFKDQACQIKRDNIVTELPFNKTTGSKLKMVVSRFNMTEAEFEYTDYLQSKGYSVELVPLGASAKQCEIARGDADIFPKFGKCYEWDSAAGHVIVESAGGLVVNPEKFSNVEYNKESMVNPPFMMFSKKMKELIEDGNDVFIHYNKK
ncbi:3'(2'),5'-bisphosphate nucleotidase CysQ [Porphyromonadaceae bacterium OttesenSCG-928-L07]|nr:3'(2'),5'-bisphosphate nucleotidase CysQ [Porphyromonadaceae bacterium OttesenSCG-928-L07]MDL2330978.1 3'(2'),5'-bisphosphate nucleotidase CysQ [Odoribacter sp. OttesenSCG-928-A06]